jgi:hypothetical protein
MSDFSWCCISTGARGADHGLHPNTLSEGDRSYLELLSSNERGLDFVVNKNSQICLAHHHLYLRPKLKRCVAPFCTSQSTKSLQQCRKDLLIFCNLHHEAKVNVHKKCYLQLQALHKESNVPTSQSNTVSTTTVLFDENEFSSSSCIDANSTHSNSNERVPLVEITNRQNEIACVEFLRTARSQSIPIGTKSAKSTPIKVTNKRGRSIYVRQLPSCESDYTQSTTPNKRSRIEFTNATITHLITNPNSSNEQNEMNEIHFLADLINSNLEEFEQAIKLSKLNDKITFALTSKQMLELQNTCNLTWKQTRTMRSYLLAANMNIFPPEYKTRETLAEYSYEFESQTIERKSGSAIVYVRVKDPILLIEQQIIALQAEVN